MRFRTLAVGMALALVALLLWGLDRCSTPSSPEQEAASPKKTPDSDDKRLEGDGGPRQELAARAPGPAATPPILLRTEEFVSKAPVPDVSVTDLDAAAGKVSWRTNETGAQELTGRTMPPEQHGLAALRPGYYIERQVPRRHGADLVLSLKKARPLAGQVIHIPPVLNQGYVLRAALDYRGKPDDARLRRSVSMRRGLRRSDVQATGRFDMHHVFQNLEADLVLEASHRQSGAYHELKRVRVLPHQSWVEIDLAGVAFTPANGSLSARLVFDGPEPHGRGELKLLREDGAPARSAHDMFTRPGKTKSVVVRLKWLRPGRYIPSVSFLAYGTYRFPAVQIADGEASTTLRFPRGATIRATISGATKPDIRRNPVMMFVEDDRGVWSGGGGYLTPESPMKTRRSAIRPGSYTVYAVAPKQKLRSPSVRVEIGEGEDRVVDLPLRQAFYVRLFFERPTGDRQHRIGIKNASGQLVQTVVVHPRSRERRIFLTEGAYTLSSDIPNLKPRMPLKVDAGAGKVLWQAR